MTEPILAIGLDSDKTFVHFLEQSAQLGVPVRPISLREIVAEGSWRISVPDDGASYVAWATDRLSLTPTTRIFSRLTDLSPMESDCGRIGRWRGLLAGLRAWLDWTPAPVVNRPTAHQHNWAKGFHELWLRARDFEVPASLTSSDGAELAHFAAAGPTIAKSTAGVRAHARQVVSADFVGFDPERGPVHLQRLIRGHHR